VVEQGCECAEFLVAVLHEARVADGDDRPEFQGMVHRRTRQHHAVDQGDRDADGQAVWGSGGGEHRAATGGSMQVDKLAQPRVRRRQHHRSAGIEVADMTDQSLVENAVDGGAVVPGAFAIPGGHGPRCGHVVLSCRHNCLRFCTST
jgi:hypothetical protein